LSASNKSSFSISKLERADKHAAPQKLLHSHLEAKERSAGTELCYGVLAIIFTNRFEEKERD
jgi:hypothetical protein